MPQNQNLILLKRSTISGTIPDVNTLEAGELAVNVADGKIFLKTETPFLTSVKSFLNSDQYPYVFNNTLSSISPSFGDSTVDGVFSTVLGGYQNDVDGAASIVLNGENNDISGDFSFILNGLNNNILSGGDYGGILGGKNNTLSHQDTFILGSNITSHLSGITYVNNLSSTGKLYGDGSELTGIVAGDGQATSLVRSNSAIWESTYLTVSSLSASWESSGGGSDVTSLSANWENTYTTVQSYSASWQDSYTVVAAGSAAWNAAAEQRAARRFDYVAGSPVSFSYSGVAGAGTLNEDPEWDVTRVAYTDIGSVSATQYAYNITWVSRLTATYS